MGIVFLKVLSKPFQHGTLTCHQVLEGDLVLGIFGMRGDIAHGQDSIKVLNRKQKYILGKLSTSPVLRQPGHAGQFVGDE